MLKITTNQNIKMSKGNDVQFPLFLNIGTTTNPERYIFKEDVVGDVEFYIINYSDVYKQPWSDTSEYEYGYNEPEISKEIVPILFKSFNTYGTIHTVVGKEDKGYTSGNKNINEDGDMIIRLASTDTEEIDAGEYLYQIKAHIKDKDNNTVYITVTNKLPIYIIDDNFNRDWT